MKIFWHFDFQRKIISKEENGFLYSDSTSLITPQQNNNITIYNAQIKY